MNRAPNSHLVAFCLVSLFAATPASADPFTPGNLVVLTVGDTTLNVGSSSATAVSLREYTTSGSFVASSLVTFNSGTSGTRLTQSGSRSLEGSLSRSADGQYLTLVGYDAARGRADVADTSTNGGPSNVVRVVGRVSIDGQVNLSTTTTNYSGSPIFSAASADGERFYLGGPLNSGTDALRTTTLGASGESTSVNNADVRVVHVFNNQVYASTRFNTIIRTDAALPTGTSGVTELVAGLADPVGFVILDQDGNGTVDTLYVANQDPTASLQKFSSTDGTNWTARGSANIVGGLTGITAVKNGSNVDIFVTAGEGTMAANTLQRFTDIAAFNASLSGSFVELVAAPTGTAFRGVAFSPSAVPEPGSLLLCAVAGAGFAGAAIRRYRNRLAAA
jgi:hypothetical protein